MRTPLSFFVPDGFDYHRSVKMGWGSRHICWQCYIFSFLKGARLQYLFKGGHKEETVSYNRELDLIVTKFISSGRRGKAVSREIHEFNRNVMNNQNH